MNNALLGAYYRYKLSPPSVSTESICGMYYAEPQVASQQHLGLGTAAFRSFPSPWIDYIPVFRNQLRPSNNGVPGTHHYSYVVGKGAN